MTTTSDIRDLIIQQHAPTVMAPFAGELPAPAQSGHRYIAGRDGLYLDLARPWLRLRHLIAPAIAVKLPYGSVKPWIATEFGKIPRELLHRFLEEAQRRAPLEYAAWIVWDDKAKRLEYLPIEEQEASRHRVTIERPRLEEHQSLAIDLHSHGSAPAFFSDTDDVDDVGEVKISGVVGNLHEGATAEWKFRLCVLGFFKDLPGPKDL